MFSYDGAAMKVFAYAAHTYEVLSSFHQIPARSVDFGVPLNRVNLLLPKGYGPRVQDNNLGTTATPQL